MRGSTCSDIPSYALLSLGRHANPPRGLQKKRTAVPIGPPDYDRRRSSRLSRAFSPFFFNFFCSASSLKKMMDYPAWHSRSEGFVFRDYDGSRLSPLAVWIRGKKIVLFRRTEKDQPSRISTEVTYETRASQGDHPLDRPAELFSAPPLTRLSPIFRGSTRPFVAKPPRRKPPLARCSFPAARANIWFRRPGC